ncbi:MAG: hypothetical protein V1794_01790 [Candidatus Glassbacteria bacterium]
MKALLNRRLEELRARLSALEKKHKLLQQELQRTANDYVRAQGGIEELEALLGVECKEVSE